MRRKYAGKNCGAGYCLKGKATSLISICLGGERQGSENGQRTQLSSRQRVCLTLSQASQTRIRPTTYNRLERNPWEAAPGGVLQCQGTGEIPLAGAPMEQDFQQDPPCSRGRGNHGPSQSPLFSMQSLYFADSDPLALTYVSSFISLSDSTLSHLPLGDAH